MTIEMKFDVSNLNADDIGRIIKKIHAGRIDTMRTMVTDVLSRADEVSRLTPEAVERLTSVFRMIPVAGDGACGSTGCCTSPQ